MILFLLLIINRKVIYMGLELPLKLGQIVNMMGWKLSFLFFYFFFVFCFYVFLKRRQIFFINKEKCTKENEKAAYL